MVFQPPCLTCLTFVDQNLMGDPPPPMKGLGRAHPHQESWAPKGETGLFNSLRTPWNCCYNS